MKSCWQALCLTGRGFETCWRPGAVAKNVYTASGVIIIARTVQHAPYTRIRRLSA
ncbi:hypothetical protein Ep4_003 [Pseudomonas phage Ep4]|uniref:Uncharacterized protein n=1 Tax=Pseudomonas phage Ep4 TaxID=3057492 RepID=A0AAU9E7H2_9CAUD|nr:hypothetical protein Ep4_003 [Pseudomonas phage Ep4]